MSKRPSLRPADEEGPRFGLLEAGLWMLGTMLAFSLVVMLIGATSPDALKDLVMLGGLSAIAFLLASALLLGPAGRPNTLAFRPVPAFLVLVSFFCGALSQIPARRIAMLMESISPSPPSEIAERAAMLRPTSVTHGVMLAVILVVLVPLAEEVFFRGAIFGSLRQGGKTLLAAATISGVGFLLSHLEPKLWPALGVVAAVLSALRGLSGSLVPSLAFHVGFNGFAVLDGTFELFGPPEHFSLSGEPELWISMGVVLTLAVLLLFMARDPKSRARRALDGGPS